MINACRENKLLTDPNHEIRQPEPPASADLTPKIRRSVKC